MKANELRKKFLAFFEEKGHAVIPSASLIPENDPTVLFTTAGMHPLVPYLLGAKHPAGKRLTNVQKCIRTGDIDDVGDTTHCTFFEMLGNWSLGDYFKKKAIAWSWEFLTSDRWLNIPKDRIYISVFEGDENAPRDNESYNYWRSHGVEEDHIFFLPKEHNWWGPAGTTGPCGPDTEMFYDTGKEKCSPDCDITCNCGKYVEIWNDVFMEYNKTADGRYEPLNQKNVDTGMGLDRTIAVLQGVDSVYETDLFKDIMKKIEDLAEREYKENVDTVRAYRIVADHIRTATFILGDQRGVTPSNVDQGYVLRRLIRRAIRFGLQIGIPEGRISEIAKVVVNQYSDVYPELAKNEKRIIRELELEEERFQRTIRQGLREFTKVISSINEGSRVIDGKSAFRL
ncbi:MAG: alanine--tRNA ligase, partial [Clostridiales bacterium]|nr:alanine--tRNA ligase [Clostridiales bacterium]